MSQRLRVLLVDDDPDVRAALRRQLLLQGYHIREAASGEEALQALPGLEVDAVISDFDMPEMNGLDFLQRVRISKPQAVRGLLTGKADVHVAARALNEGAADRFIVKPWDNVDLSGILEIAMRSRRATTPAPGRS